MRTHSREFGSMMNKDLKELLLAFNAHGVKYLVVGGYAVFELHSKEEAVASAVEFMQLHKDFLPGWEGTCELRAFAPGGP